MNFGEKLRVWIEDNYGTLASFCRSHNLKYSKVHNYISGIREPDLAFLKIITERGCDLRWLLSQDDSSPPESDVTNKIKQLEEENRLLRDKISRISFLSQAVDLVKIRKK